MSSFTNLFWVASMVMMTSLVTNGAEVQFSDLVRYVPNHANAMVLVDAKELFASPLAKRENWQGDRQKQFEAGLTSIPPQANKIVIAAHLDVDVMSPSWEAAVAAMDSQVTLTGLSERFGGTLDKVNSVPAVRLPDDSFVVQFPDGLIGAMAPGQRQQIARWVGRKSSSLTPYLSQGVHYAGANAQVIMVLDLQHAFAADSLQAGLEALETVKKSKVDVAELAKLFSSLNGVTLGIHFGEKPSGRLKFDFGQDPSMLSPMAKPLILDILGSYGVMVDEVADWKPQVKGNEVSLGGRLDDEGLSRLASMVQLPSSALHQVHASQNPSATANKADPSQPSSVLAITQKYYASVQHHLNRLRERMRDVRTMGQLALWLQNDARHVDQLPTLHVDKEMLEFGSYISSQLRDASMVLKGATIRKRVDEVAGDQSARIYGGALGNVSQDNWQASGVGYGGGLGVNYGRRRETNALYGIARKGGYAGALKSEDRQQQQARDRVDAQARAGAATSVQQIRQNIEVATTQIRQSMTDKYQVQF